MELKRNAFKHALAAHQRQIGMWVSLPSPGVAEGLSHAGFDWLVFDTEHAPADLETILSMLHAAQAGASSIVVRPSANDSVLIKRFLDIGAQTLLLPQVNSAQEAADAVAAMRYPPEGIRGVAGLTRAAGYGRIKNYMKQASSELCCLVQAETVEAIECLEQIAAVDGVDGVFIGPSDLAASLGYPGEIMHPEVQKTIRDCAKRLQAVGTPSGILATNDSFAQECIEMGYTFVAAGSDLIMLMRGADALAEKFGAGTAG